MRDNPLYPFTQKSITCRQFLSIEKGEKEGILKGGAKPLLNTNI